jgi:hypothetical protein
MTTKKAVSLSKSLKKYNKYLIKDVTKDKKRKTRRRRKRNRTKSSSLSDLYTYESPVTNNAVSLDKGNSTNSNFNVQNNVNVIDGLKDFLAVKK